MSRSAIYTVNASTSTVPVNGVIPVGNIVRRFGQNLDASGNGIITSGCGYYITNVSVTLTGTPSAATTATIQLYKDGSAVPGALASVTTLDTETVNVAFSAITRNFNCEPSILTLVVTGVAIDLVNVAVAVEKE